MPRLGTPNLNISTWAEGENPGAGSQSVDNLGLNGNWLKIDRALGTQHNKDGTHKSNVITGANLVQSGSGVVVDGVTLEFSSDKMQVKDASITGAKLAAGVVDDSTLQLLAGVLSVKSIGNSQISDVNGSKLVTNSVPMSALEYKMLICWVNQSGGTAAPTVNVWTNTIGGSVSTSYSNVGRYLLTLTGLFTLGKTFPLLGSNGRPGYTFAQEYGDGNSILISHADNSDNWVDGMVSAPLIVLVQP